MVNILGCVSFEVTKSVVFDGHEAGGKQKLGTGGKVFFCPPISRYQIRIQSGGERARKAHLPRQLFALRIILETTPRKKPKMQQKR